MSTRLLRVFVVCNRSGQSGQVGSLLGFAACAAVGVPAVATLHNYLQVCPR